MKKIRKKYSKQFKIDAVNLVLKQGFNAAEAARNLDINENLLRRWKKEFEGKQQETFQGNSSMTPEQEELKRLRKEVAQLKVEKEILKKAAAFFRYRVGPSRNIENRITSLKKRPNQGLYRCFDPQKQ